MIRAVVFILLAALAGCPGGTPAPQGPPAEAAADAAAPDGAATGETTAAADTGDKTAPAADAKDATAAAEPPKEPPKPDPQAEIIGQCMFAKAEITRTPSGDYACVGRPKDAGKHCTNGTECPNSVCLADSMTCSPLWPLYGCYDILSGVGNRQKYCRDK